MISCNNYDYIEIVCTYHYPIKLTLKSGQVVFCVCSDTSRNESREECLKVIIEKEQTERLVVLDEIEKMEARVGNPHFQSVTFT